MNCVSDSTSQYHVNPAFQPNIDNGFNNAKPVGRYAITVRHAQIQYTDVMGALISGAAPTTNEVLRDFNMSVEKGHIYGLLGPSGCGKTSILRAIVGQIDLKAGEILVFGHKPKTPQSGIPGTTVGYMPQELSLMEEFTIEELLFFYGQLAGMSSREIIDKCNYFVKLLDLPKLNRIIGTLSGGQQRRVSFAIALIHSPPILILDEPTVGVDPLLRESIWKYLRKLTQEKITVVITTHYIEEASQADTVGLMRYGKLMAEQSPQSLTDCLQCRSLEEVLVTLCVHQSRKEQVISSVSDAYKHPGLQTVADQDVETTETTSFVKKKVHPIQRVRVLAWKDTVSFLRHYCFLLYVLFFPPLIAIVFYYTYGRTPYDVKISVFNQETDCFSSELPSVNQYGNSTNCKIPNFLSCKILEALTERQILTVSSESERAAENDVRRGRTWGSMTISKNFTSALLKRAEYISPSDAENEVLDMGTVYVTMDKSDQVVSNFVEAEILLSLKRVLEDTNAVCHRFRHMKDLPIQFKTPIYGGQETSFIDTALPGLICGLCVMNPLTSTLSVLLPEKISGSMERALVSGVRMGEVILSHFIICFFPSFVAMTLVVIIPYVFFGLGMNGSFWTITVLLIPLGVCNMIIGFILAVVCTTVSGALLVGSGFFFGSLFTSGTLWPVQGIYPYVRPLCWLVPMTFTTEAFRYVTVRGWSFYDKTVQLALISVIIWSCILFVLLLITLRFKR